MRQPMLYVLPLHVDQLRSRGQACASNLHSHAHHSRDGSNMVLLGKSGQRRVSNFLREGGCAALTAAVRRAVNAGDDSNVSDGFDVD